MRRASVFISDSDSIGYMALREKIQIRKERPCNECGGIVGVVKKKKKVYLGLQPSQRMGE